MDLIQDMVEAYDHLRKKYSDNNLQDLNHENNKAHEEEEKEIEKDENDDDDENENEKNKKAIEKQDFISQIYFEWSEYFNIFTEETYTTDNLFLFPLSLLILFKFSHEIIWLCQVVLSTIIISSGFGLSFCIIAHSMNAIKNSAYEKGLIAQDEEDEVKLKQSFLYKYNVFLSDYVEEFAKALYGTEDSHETKELIPEYIQTLKDKSQHLTIELPFEFNDKLIMYYDAEEEKFIYYTKTSDVIYKIANACCARYVLEKKCIPLFKDEDELEFIKFYAFNFMGLNVNKDNEPLCVESNHEEIEACHEDEEGTNSIKSDTDSYEDLSTETETPVETNKPLFKTKKKNEVVQTNNKRTDLCINSFVYKGTLNDYNSKYKERRQKRDICYGMFSTGST
jgi:hypothetical protein